MAEFLLHRAFLRRRGGAAKVAAADHQSANAAAYAAGGAALWLREAAWNREVVAQQVAQLLSLPVRWTQG